MPEIPHQSPSIPLADPQAKAPEAPVGDSAENEDLLKQELARLTPPNEKLLELVEKSPPPPEWRDEEEEPPF